MTVTVTVTLKLACFPLSSQFILMVFQARAGCPMCGIVANAATSQLDSCPPISNTQSQLDILWRDGNFTAYRENTTPVSSKGHIIIAFK